MEKGVGVYRFELSSQALSDGAKTVLIDIVESVDRVDESAHIGLDPSNCFEDLAVLLSKVVPVPDGFVVEYPIAQ